ncbi:MAG: ferredoxin [Candidatus Nanoarchaeia archaeon]
MKYKIDHDRPNCIGCGACAAMSPDHWEMDDDGKSNIINGTRLDNGCEAKEIEQNDYETNFEAAECCPVNVIHLTNNETKEKII